MQVDKNHKCKIHQDLKDQAVKILKELTDKKYCLHEILTILNLAIVDGIQSMTIQETMQQIKIKVMKGVKKAIDEHTEINISKLT